MSELDAVSRPRCYLPRRLAVAATVTSMVALIAAGCGSAAKPAAKQSSSVDAEAGSSGDHVVSRELEAGKGAPEADGVFPRTVVHYAGTTAIKAAPQKVAVISTGQLDTLLALDQVPIASTRAEYSGLVPKYLLDAFPKQAAPLKAMADIGERTEPDLEAIAQAKPDLILINSVRGAKLYKSLSAIAPTVVTIGNGVNWKNDFLLVADSLGRQGDAEKTLDTLHAEADAFRKTLPTSAPTVSFLQSTGDKTRIMGHASFAGGAAEDLGLARPKSQQFDDTSEEISAEQLELADADWIFYAGNGDGIALIEKAPLWRTLTAVTSRQTKAVDLDPYFMNAGPVAAQLVQKQIIATVK